MTCKRFGSLQGILQNVEPKGKYKFQTFQNRNITDTIHNKFEERL